MKLHVTVDYKTHKVTGNCKGLRKVVVWARCKRNVLDAVRFALNTLVAEMKEKENKEPKDSC